MNGQGQSRPPIGDAALNAIGPVGLAAPVINLNDRLHDEDAAVEARARYRVQAMTPIQPDCVIAHLLEPGEWVLALRRSAVLERRQPSSGAVGPGLAGDLYVTSRRLLHVGRLTLAFALEEIDEAMLAGDRLLLVLCEGAGVALDVGSPQLLRVEIATARAAARK